jgi:hypothetical protein
VGVSTWAGEGRGGAASCVAWQPEGQPACRLFIILFYIFPFDFFMLSFYSLAFLLFQSGVYCLLERKLKQWGVALRDGTWCTEFWLCHVISQNLYRANWCSGNTLHLYSEGKAFESRLCYPLYWRKFFLLSSVTGRMLGYYCDKKKKKKKKKTTIFSFQTLPTYYSWSTSNLIRV